MLETLPCPDLGLNDLPSSLDDERQAIASWLSSLNFRASQNEFIQKRRKGTGGWFLECQEFKDWRDGTSEMLWCPGDGKIISVP